MPEQDNNLKKVEANKFNEYRKFVLSDKASKASLEARKVKFRAVDAGD